MHESVYVKSLSREYTKYVLNIDITLNESDNISKEIAYFIIKEHILYENFLDTLKKYAGDVKDTFLNGFKDFKDFASTLYKVISQGLSNNFSNSLLRTFSNSDIRKSIDEILKKIGRADLLKDLLVKVKSISNPIAKLLVSIGFTSIAKFFYDKFKNLDIGKENIKNEVIDYIKNYLSDAAINTLEGFVSGGFSSLKSWLEKVGLVAATIYNTIKSTIMAYKEAFLKQDSGDTWATKLVKENIEELHEGEFCPQCLKEYILERLFVLEEAEYKGRKVPLGKPMAGDVKKFKVYVKNNKGNVVKVNFGQKGVKIKKGNPKRRKSFRARHHCDTNPGPRWKARYWSCKKW